MKICIIAAISKNMVIGNKGKIPWHLPEDLKRFREITKGKIVVMGRKTYQSIGAPLPGRLLNIIITNKKNFYAPCCICPNIETLLSILKIGKEEDYEVFFIGGERIFKEALKIADKIFLTFINHDFEGDVFFPEIDLNIWEETQRQKGITDEKNPYEYWFLEFSRKQ